MLNKFTFNQMKKSLARIKSFKLYVISLQDKKEFIKLKFQLSLSKPNHQ